MSAQTQMTFDQVLNAGGTELGTSTWHRITQRQVGEFAELTGDRQWIHVDEERAKASPFGSTLVHGLFTLSLLPTFLNELFEVTDLSMGVNYGLDRVRFPDAVPVGSQVRASATITSVDAKGADRVMVNIRVTFECDEADKPACVADLIALFYR